MTALDRLTAYLCQQPGTEHMDAHHADMARQILVQHARELAEQPQTAIGLADRLSAVMDICDEIERGTPTPEVADIVLRIHRAALGDKPQLPKWAVDQLKDRDIDPRAVTHFIRSRDGDKIAAAVNGAPIHLSRT